MRTILIVEDDPRNVRILSRYLTSREGLAVKHTENIEEVIQIALAREVDLVIMDVSLSHSVYQGKPVDGIQITQLLKRNPETASLPIVLVTAHAMQGDRERLLQQSGADGYISKPVLDYQHSLIKLWRSCQNMIHEYHFSARRKCITTLNSQNFELPKL